MGILYIRHGEDKKGNYKYDEKLTKEGKKEIVSFTLDLIEKYGLPDIILYSPFYRTKQTKRIMKNTIYKEFNKKVKTNLDKRLGRFFTKKQSSNPDIHPITYDEDPIIYETWDEFRKRVENQFEDIRTTHSDKIVWNITHSLVILNIAKKMNISRSKYVNYLDFVEIDF